ncbi:hypothetical protein GZD23_004026 [Salmonella enterica subsp. enterica]|nr:hypothetical protein [Salmonella enterica]EEG3130281.1 hypothetical protein [Salmonella enterica subsp. enterica serovar Nima]EIV1999649.1 hypothetical protein [Salmonella enterica subsp. enterica serovar Telelkebir]EEC4477020.1 hypothetical protein [Salmonella enterica]EEI4748860.1 hypothetical protein [Salmonella enterica]
MARIAFMFRAFPGLFRSIKKMKPLPVLAEDQHPEQGLSYFYPGPSLQPNAR